MNQSPNRGNGMHFRPPVVTGTEERYHRTGVVYRPTVQTMAMTKSRSAGAEHPSVLPECSTGILPCNAPLANPFVPFQRENAERYPTQRALARGTLYPGLDLPLMGMVNNDKLDTPLNELMALQFAVTELGLYLDMHPEDTEALSVFRDYVSRAAAAKAEYEKKNGPLLMKNAGEGGCWDWICDPWPWEFSQEG